MTSEDDSDTDYFLFPEPHWTNVRQILGCEHDDYIVRGGLYTVADILVNGRLTAASDRAKARQLEANERKTAARISKLSNELLAILSELPPNTILHRFTDRAKVTPKLLLLRAASDMFRGAPARRATNVDDARNYAWQIAGRVYERATKKKVGVSVGAPLRKNAGQPTGKFVEFLKAFSAGVPGEPEPTGDQIRWFIRNTWRASERKLLSGAPLRQSRKR